MKQWHLYKTAQIELAVESMAARNKHSILKKTYNTKNPIYVKTNHCRGVPFFLWNPRVKSMDRELERWKVEGGVLIDNGGDYELDERIQGFDAALFAEAPIDSCFLNFYGKRCKKEIIVFRPPTWAEHEATVGRLFPTGLAMERGAERIRQHMQEGLSPKFRQVLKDCNIDAGPFSFAASDKELADELDMEVYAFAALRARMLEIMRRKYWQPLMVLIPKISPDNPAYLPIYRFIENLPDRANGERYLQDATLRAMSKEYKAVVRAMVREGCLERRPYVYVWDLNQSVLPIPEVFDRRHRKATTELQFLKQLVDSATSYPLDRKA